MTTTSPVQLTIEEFLRYKNVNMDMSPEVQEYYNTNKNKFNKINGHQWRKYEQKPADNWLIAKKFNQNDEEKLYSQFRSILNKLSDSNFNTLAKDLIALEITKQEQLAKLGEFIFNKAIVENKFSVTYAKLSKELIGYYIKENDKTYYFRELLINRCQMMFNDCISYDPTLDNKTLVTKETAIGCMIFIGELYNNELLTNKIINSCLLLLLMKTNPNKSHLIECICSLMRTVGKQFSEKCNKESNIIFEKLEKLINSGVLQNKDRFALMDLMDLKKSAKW